jgi:putative mRNA 3-end processing factor
VGSGPRIVGQPFGKAIDLNGVRLSLHPAGHLLGSAQVRVESRGEVWVVSGDYKVEADRTCETFEVVRCNTFISESTFGLPIFRWHPQEQIFDEINQWWEQNQEQGRTSILLGYALGKAQRLLSGIDASRGPILIHGAVQRYVDIYRRAGIELPPTIYAGSDASRLHRGKALVIAPPSAAASAGWLRKFGSSSLALASGWMQIRGTRRRRAVDRGFVLSDHADWDGLLTTIRATGAERIGVTHGYINTLVRYLSEQGMDAYALPTRYEGESSEEPLENEDITPEAGSVEPEQSAQESVSPSEAFSGDEV